MNRQKLQAIALTRLEEAEILLDNAKWSGAYYLCGYAIECGLKSCLLRFLGESEAVFGDARYLKNLADCWTHDLIKLVNLAGLDGEFGAARGANASLNKSWTIAQKWTEQSRYEDKTEVEAKELFDAVNHQMDGVFPWIQARW